MQESINRYKALQEVSRSGKGGKRKSGSKEKKGVKICRGRVVLILQNGRSPGRKMKESSSKKLATQGEKI